MAFRIGQRVAYLNLGYVNLGTVTSVAGTNRYLVEWDDGYGGGDSGRDAYGEGELLEVR